MHIWDADEQKAYIPHEFGAAASPTPYGFRDWLIDHPDIAAYFAMDGTTTQKEEVSEVEVPSNVPNIGVKAPRLDTMYWGDDSSAFKFGQDKTPITLNATSNGPGSVSGRFRVYLLIGGGSTPYPWVNYGVSADIILSESSGITGEYPGMPGGLSGQWSLLNVDTGMYKISTSGSSSTNIFNESFFESGFVDTYDTLSSTWKWRPIPESIGYYNAGNICKFEGTAPFSLVVDLRFRTSDDNAIIPNPGWIVSCFNADKTEGWGLGLVLTSYDSLVYRLVRRNALGEDNVDFFSMASQSQSYNMQQLQIEASYDGTTMRLSCNNIFDGIGAPSPTTVASSRSIAAGTKELRIADGFCGTMDDLIIFDAKLDDAEFVDVANHRDDVYQASTEGEHYNGTASITEDPWPAVYDDSRSVLKWNPGTWPTYSTGWEGFLGEPIVGIAVRVDPDEDNAIICEWFYDVEGGIGMRAVPRTAGVNSHFQHGVNVTAGGLFPHATDTFPIVEVENSGVHLEENTTYWVTADVETNEDGHLVTMGFWTNQPPMDSFSGVPNLEASILVYNASVPYYAQFTGPKKTGLGTYNPMSPYARLLSFKTISL